MANFSYGLVTWWLSRQAYSSADFEIEDTYSKTKDKSIDSAYDRIMTDAQNVTPNPKLASALKDLAATNRNFRREHKVDIDATIDSSLQEAFKDRVRVEVDIQLGIYSEAPVGDRNKVRSNILSNFESVSISDIPKQVEKTLFVTIQSELETPIIREASISVTGSPMTKQELFELWHSDRSTWARIKVAEKQILMS